MIQCPHCFSVGDSILYISHKEKCPELIISKSRINIHLLLGAGGSGTFYKVIDPCTSYSKTKIQGSSDNKKTK